MLTPLIQKAEALLQATDAFVGQWHSPETPVRHLAPLNLLQGLQPGLSPWRPRPLSPSSIRHDTHLEGTVVHEACCPNSPNDNMLLNA